MRSDGSPYEWAVAVDDIMADGMDRADHSGVVNFQALGDLTKIAHPTWDHFLPLLYALAQRDKADRLFYFNQGLDLGSISIRSPLLIR